MNRNLHRHPEPRSAFPTRPRVRTRPALAAVLPLLLLAGAASEPAVAQPAAPAQAGPRSETEATLPPLDRAAQAAIIDSVAAGLNLEYVFADVAREMEKHVRGRLRSGAYDAHRTIPGFAEALTQDLQAVSKDKHLRVGFLPPAALESDPDISPERLRARDLEEAQRRNFGFEAVRRLEGNVGYLDLRQFYDATIGGPTAIAAMNLLGHVDAMIFDLRQNGGGDPTMIQLITSYLFDEPTHLNSFYVRRGDFTRQFWTYASVPGPSLSGVPVWVLTSSRTFSGAEEFAYNLKSYRRGTIVGEVTGGGAHPVNRHIFPDQHVFVTVPFGRAINPNTKTNWEGTGVEPDIRVPAEKALEVAHLEALKLLRGQAADPASAQAYDWAIGGLEARSRPWPLEPPALRAYAGVYGPRRVEVEGNGLVYQREGRPRLRLLPAGEDFFLVEGLDYFRVRFSRDAAGKIERFIGLYDDGHTDENLRTGDLPAGS